LRSLCITEVLTLFLQDLWCGTNVSFQYTISLTISIQPLNIIGKIVLSTAKVSKNSLFGSAGKVSGATAFSRILGLVREQVMAYYFGAGMATDAFITAFRIPNLLRDMFAEGALSSAFVPIFKEKLVNNGDKDAFKLADIVITLILLVVGIIVLLGILAAPAIVYIMANGFTVDPVKFNLTVTMTRIMMAYLLLVSLSALVMGMLNSYGKFGIPALSPALFNIGTVIAVISLYNYLETPIYTLAIGVLVGGVGQLLIQLPLLFKIGYRFRFSFSFLDEGLKKVVKLITPIIIGLSAGRINILVSTLIASFLMEGALSYLNYSYRLMHFPLGVFAVAIGTVALPNVSEMVASKEYSRLNKTFTEAIGANFFVIIPSAIFLALMGYQVVELIYQYGAFDVIDTEQTYLALLHYSYGLIGFASVRVTVPFYYAFSDSKLPMKISIFAVVMNLVLYYPLIKLVGFAGLAAATSLSGLINFALLVYFLPEKGIKVDYLILGLSFIRILLAALVAFYVARMIPFNILIDSNSIMQRIVELILSMVTAGLLYILFCVVLKVREVSILKRLFSRS